MEDKRRIKAVWVITLVCFFIGLSTMVQWRTQSNISKTMSQKTIDELAATLIQVENAKDSLVSEIAEMHTQLDKYRTGESARQLLQKELEKNRVLGGLTELEGPGVVIVLDDSKEALSVEGTRKDNRNDYYIHDWYIRELVNALLTGGAEAVAVNNQRLISTSEIFCGGTTVFINGEYVIPPFVITAVGDSKNLMASIQMISTYLLLKDYQQRFGIIFDALPKEKVVVPAYQGEINFKYARPAEKKAEVVK